VGNFEVVEIIVGSILIFPVAVWLGLKYMRFQWESDTPYEKRKNRKSGL
jgi:hypothetical protein